MLPPPPMNSHQYPTAECQKHPERARHPAPRVASNQPLWRIRTPPGMDMSPPQHRGQCGKGQQNEGPAEITPLKALGQRCCQQSCGQWGNHLLQGVDHGVPRRRRPGRRKQDKPAPGKEGQIQRTQLWSANALDEPSQQGQQQKNTTRGRGIGQDSKDPEQGNDAPDQQRRTIRGIGRDWRQRGQLHERSKKNTFPEDERKSQTKPSLSKRLTISLVPALPITCGCNSMHSFLTPVNGM